MRRVAAFMLHAEDEQADRAEAIFEDVSSRIDRWLANKGGIPNAPTTDEFKLTLSDGRVAKGKRGRVESQAGVFDRAVLVEPTSEGSLFGTALTVAWAATSVDVHCTLEVGQPSRIIAPIAFDARCPRMLRDLVCRSEPRWRVGATSHRCVTERLTGTAGGAALASLLSDDARSLPIVVVSEEQGFPLLPDASERLASELACLANVYAIDDAASWELTATLGRDWSCFSAAIRLYWPKMRPGGDPFDHPLWTAARLLTRHGDADVAVDALVGHLRRRLMAVASFTVHEPPSIVAIRRDAQRADRERQLSEANTAEDYRQLAESFARSNDVLQAELAQLREQLEQTGAELNDLRARQNSSGDAEEGVEPERETPPATVAEAVGRARATLSADLIFGDDCDRGVKSVRETAGPPDKVLAYLQQLAEAARMRRDNQLGTDVFKWLRQRNVAGSGERGGTRNNRKAKQNRTWHDGQDRRYFDAHLKPNESTSPDQCVRIYFEWVESARKYAVGWVGRHPD